MFELKESDIPELERLAKSGYEWVARDWNEQVYAYTAKPFKNTTTWVGGAKCEKIIGLGINSQIGVHWSDPEPLNIAAAIAQIKATKKPKQYGEFVETSDLFPSKPLTWNDRINHMTVEEKARYIRRYIDCAGCPINKLGGSRCDDYCTDAECVKKLTELLNSPCTEAADD